MKYLKQPSFHPIDPSFLYNPSLAQRGFVKTPPPLCEAFIPFQVAGTTHKALPKGS